MGGIRQLSECNTCPIVGIGASAGGLKALLELFGGLPATTGMAFVVIQHLDAKNNSVLADSIAKVTPMTVSEVKHNDVVQPNHIYIAMPDTELSVENGILHVEPRSSGVKRYTPIDSFLKFLAGEKTRKVIGVILSGKGADGSQGIKSMKMVGGITFAQDPRYAEHDSMPSAAISTGMVDFVLSSQEMASALAKLSPLGTDISSTKVKINLFQEEEGALGILLSLLHNSSGINFAEYKQLTVKRRIKRRMIFRKLDKLDDYVTLLRRDPAELAVLQKDMLINVTKFFREPQAFDILKDIAFPAIINSLDANAPIRMWVPGCSSGEEAYSLTIAMLEFLESNNMNRTIQVFATDISAEVIDKARAGIYPKSIMTDVSPARLSRFFIEVAEGYQVSKALRDVCVFARQDIGKSPPISKVDLISCRNVMIYFEAVLQKRMFPIFHYALNARGFLILGASESIGTFANLFELVDKKYRIHKKKAGSTPLMFEFSVAEHAATTQHSIKDYPDVVRAGTLVEVQKEADRIVVSKYTPPGVIINSKLDIIQFRGHTGAFLEPAAGMPSVNLLKMVREGLFLGLRAAVNQAKKVNGPARKVGLHVIKDGHPLLVNIDVIPIKNLIQKGEYFLVMFHESTSRPIESKLDSSRMARAHRLRDSEEILDLKQELMITTEYLQAIIDQHEAVNEDLRFAHEEVKSSNEELQSMNEEMETSQEELQSTNEELMTLNEELKNRNAELNYVNNDIQNLLNSIKIPLLILGNDLRVKRFNSGAEKILNLISSDVGRPISNIIDLEKMALEVIDTLNSKDQKVQDRWGQWYFMQICPYKRTDKMIDGVVISFTIIASKEGDYGTI